MYNVTTYSLDSCSFRTVSCESSCSAAEGRRIQVVSKSQFEDLYEVLDPAHIRWSPSPWKLMKSEPVKAVTTTSRQVDRRVLSQ